MSERQAPSVDLEVALHSSFTCTDVKKERDNTVQSGDCEQIINNTNSYQMQEGTCNLEPCRLTSMEVAHSDIGCKCDHDSQMLENPGGTLSIAGDDESHHQLEGEDKLSFVEISEGDPESNHSHTITVNTSSNKFEQSEYLGLHECLVGTNDSTEAESNKLHSCRISFENRDWKSVNQNLRQRIGI